MAGATKAATENYCSSPVISKLYCESSQRVFVVRKRPNVVTGGGFVVADCFCTQKIVFKVDGCGVLGKQRNLILREADGSPLLLIRQKGGTVQALSIHKKWRSYSFNYEGSEKPVFTLKEPNSCLIRNNEIRICTEPRRSKRDWDFEIKGHFPDKDCVIVDYLGNSIAEIGLKKEMNEVITSKDLYQVVVKPGIDQAFVFGVIAILDYMFGESTRC